MYPLFVACLLRLPVLASEVDTYAVEGFVCLFLLLANNQSFDSFDSLMIGIVLIVYCTAAMGE